MQTAGKRRTGLAGRSCDRLASLAQLCEEDGRWPEQLRIAYVTLLSKGGMPVDKLHSRPITVMPLVYRAWAKARAKQLRTWLEKRTELLVGHRETAEFQAAVLATARSLGRATGEEAGVVRLDFSKAYDSLDLEFLEQALRKAGVAEQILRPTLSMYKALKAVRVGDGVGPAKEPDFGLPAGCPFATFFMAVVTLQWRRQLRMLPSKPSVRAWVDDCAAFVQGAARLRSAWRERQAAQPPAWRAWGRRSMSPTRGVWAPPRC